MFLVSSSRIFAYLLCLPLSLAVIFIAQFLEKLTAGWFVDKVSYLFFKTGEIGDFIFSLIPNIFNSSFTGVILIDFIIKSFLIICLSIGGIFIFALSEDREGKNFLGLIFGIPILLFVFGIPLLPYAAYLISFWLLGLSLGSCYYLFGYRASLFLFLPLILVLCSASNVFTYINLGESVYAPWIMQDKATISNFTEFWLYTIRASVFGARASDGVTTMSVK
jgi:hypothetical protein